MEGWISPEAEAKFFEAERVASLQKEIEELKWKLMSEEEKAQVIAEKERKKAEAEAKKIAEEEAKKREQDAIILRRATKRGLTVEQYLQDIEDKKINAKIARYEEALAYHKERVAYLEKFLAENPKRVLIGK